MLKTFDIQHKERIARQRERREEVISLLDGFREKRLKKEE